MLAALKHIFFPPAYKHEAHLAYVRLVEQSRAPWFYREQAVPDTLDGRFDVIILHLFLVIHRLGNEAPEFVRALCEAFIADMDRSLREMGVGDTGISHRVKKMVQAFYGRLQSYERTIADPDAFAASLARNLYRLETVMPHTAALYGYCTRNLAHLRAQDAANIATGTLTFLD